MNRTGRCVNLGNCTIANQKQTITMPSGLDLRCPECGREMVEVASTGSGSRFGVVAIALGAAVALGIAAWMLYGTIARKQPGAAIPAASTAPASSNGASSGAAAILRLHGSNTIGAELGPALAQEYLRAQGAQNVRIIRGSGEEAKVEGLMPGESTPQTIEIEARGSATAFTDLKAGLCDIGMASRPAKADEIAQLGDLTSTSSEHVLGLDGVAVIVNRDNPVDSVSKQDLARIFTGQITDWGQVAHGKPGAIHILARDSKSGTADTFQSLVMPAKSAFPTSAQRFEDSNQLADKVASDPGAIGFVGLPYVRSTKALAVSDQGARALLPNRLTVATEDYLLSRRLFLYTLPGNTNPAVNRFVEFALGKKGQDVVEQAGFIAQHVRVEKVEKNAESPADYKRLTEGSERLSLDYRFRPGSSTLDNKAVADLQRLTDFVTVGQYRGSDLILLGFADSSGDQDSNLKLSRQRAEAVSAALARQGLSAGQVTGFGDAMPVAGNDSEEGRQRNRRVEVWIRKK